MSNGYARAICVATAALWLCALAAPAWAQIELVESDARRIAGQSTSNLSSTVAGQDPTALRPPQTSATMRVGFNINADAAAGLVAPEIGFASFDMGFILSHAGSYDLALDFFLHGQLLRLADDEECMGAVSLADISINSLVRLEDEMEFPLDVVLPGASLAFDAGTATFNFGEQDSRVIQIRGDTNEASTYRLSLVVSATALSQSCEVSARFGADNGSTTSCDACVYPGAGGRSRDEDGLFVTVTVTSLCGDVRLDPGEECDFGPLNGAAESCCDAFCHFASASQVCRPAAGDCDQSDTCSGTSADCPSDAPKPAGSECTADRSSCTDDVCDSGGACTHPLRAGTTCAGGLCTCDADGLFCTGPVSCAAEGGLCIQLPPPCGEDETCDEQRDLCLLFGTPIPTATATPTATPAEPQRSATPTAIAGLCTGDCNGDRVVPLEEIVLGVDIALGMQPVSACTAFDRDRDGTVVVDELVVGVANLLTICPSD